MSIWRTIHTAWASYAAMIVMMAASLLTVRFATRALSPEEFGLWSFTMQSVGYLLLLDFGVANSLGRLFGEPFAKGNPHEMGKWVSMAAVTLAAQGLLILAIGFYLKSWILSWFDIPAHLLPQANDLWIAFLIIQACSFPLRVLPAILHVQNRSYWAHASSIVSTLVTLGTFYAMLKSGHGVLSYAWSTAMGVTISGAVWAITVACGPHRFKLSLLGLTKSHIRELVSYSSAIFIISIAVQVTMASQGLVITKILGLTAGAMFAVTARLPNTLSMLSWRPFDAFVPRWQASFCAGDTARVKREFSLIMRATLLCAGATFIGVAIVNPVFIKWWTLPEFYGGFSLNIALATLIFLQTISHCCGYILVIQKALKGFVIATILGVVLALICMCILTTNIGLAGVPLGLIISEMLATCVYTVYASTRLLSLSLRDIFQNELLLIFPLAAVAIAFGFWLQSSILFSHAAAFFIGAAVAAFLSLPLLWRVYKLATTARQSPT